MAKKVFNAVLTADSINDLKKELLSYKTDFLQARLVELTERLAEKGVEIAKANVTKLDAIFTGELIDSLHSEKGSISKGTAIFYILTAVGFIAKFAFSDLGASASLISISTISALLAL